MGASEAAEKGREESWFPPTSAPGGPRSQEAAGSGAERGAAGARSLRPAPATRASDPRPPPPPATPGRPAGMDSAAGPAFAPDKPALGPGPPPPPPALGPGDCAQARKNFTVSHLLDLEEVAAAGRLVARPAPRAEAREGAAREPSGGSSGSEAAPQDGECAGPGPGMRGQRLVGPKGRARDRRRKRGLWLCRSPAWEGEVAAGPPGVRALGATSRAAGVAPAAAAAAALAEVVCPRWTGRELSAGGGQIHLQSLGEQGAVLPCALPRVVPLDPSTPKQPGRSGCDYCWGN